MATLPAPSSNSSNVSTLSQWAGPYITNMLGKTQAYADTPYQVYQGPQTADVSNLQNKVFQGLGSLNFPSNLGQSFSSTGAYQPPPMNMGAYQPQPIGTGTQPGLDQNAYTAALPRLDTGFDWKVPPPLTLEQEQQVQKIRDQNLSLSDSLRMQGVPGFGGQPGQGPQGIAGLPQQPQQPSNIASQYMNPYLQSVLTPQLEELRRQNDITNMKANAGLTSAGAYGGGRQAIMNAENNRNLMQEMNKTVGQGYANAYDKAIGQFNIEKAQSKTLADMMAEQGRTQRDIDQQGITADYNEFLAQRDYPQKMLQFQQSMLQGLPIATTTNQAAPLSGIGQLTSTIGGMGNIVESLKKFNLTGG
jgi:hypothetical protein